MITTKAISSLMTRTSKRNTKEPIIGEATLMTTRKKRSPKSTRRRKRKKRKRRSGKNRKSLMMRTIWMSSKMTKSSLDSKRRKNHAGKVTRMRTLICTIWERTMLFQVNRSSPMMRAATILLKKTQIRFLRFNR